MIAPRRRREQIGGTAMAFLPFSTACTELGKPMLSLPLHHGRAAATCTRRPMLIRKMQPAGGLSGECACGRGQSKNC
jgi:hypothetical protein